MADDRKGMVALIVLTVVFGVGLAVVGGITAYRQLKEKEADDTKEDTRHAELVSKLDGLNVALGDVQKDVGLEAQLRSDYPYGYILYGYQDGVTSYIPIEPLGKTRITCNPSSIKLERDSVSGKFILRISEVQYLRSGENPFTLNVHDLEWKFPANDDQLYEWRLLSENGQVFSLVVEPIGSHGGQYVFVLAFMIDSEQEVLTRIQEDRNIANKGFYTRRLERLQQKYGQIDHEEIGQTLCLLGDALCHRGEVELGLSKFRSGVEMLERLGASSLGIAYGNFARDLYQFGNKYEEAVLFAEKSKAYNNHRSAVEDSTQLGVNSTLAFCLIKLGRRSEGIPLIRDNALASLIQYIRDGKQTHQLNIALLNYGNTLTSVPISMTEFETTCRELEQEAYHIVHGSLNGYHSQLKFSPNPEFRGFRE